MQNQIVLNDALHWKTNNLLHFSLLVRRVFVTWAFSTPVTLPATNNPETGGSIFGLVFHLKSIGKKIDECPICLLQNNHAFDTIDTVD